MIADHRKPSITDAPEELRGILRDRTLTPARRRDLILRRLGLSYSSLAREAGVSRQAIGGTVAGHSRSARVEAFLAHRTAVPRDLLFPEPRQRAPRRARNADVSAS